MNLGIGLSLTSGGRNAAYIPPTQTVNFGAKTRLGYGGHDLGVVGGGTPVIALEKDFSNATTTHWRIDAYNRLVPRNGATVTYGNAPPTFNGPYTLTVTLGGLTSTVTVTLTANTWSARWREDNVADIYTGVGNELSNICFNTSLAGGDIIDLRSGEYNASLNAQFRLFKERVAVPTGAVSIATGVVIQSTPAYGARLWAAQIDGATVQNKFVTFKNLTFANTNSGGSPPPMLAGVTSPKFVRVEACRFWGDLSLVGSTAALESTQLCNGIVSTTSGATDWQIVDNDFNVNFRSIHIAGANPVIIGNTFQNNWDDCMQLDNIYNWDISWNTMFNHKAANGDLHGDFIQMAFTAMGAGVYVGGPIVGNIMFRGLGTANNYDGQGIHMGNASELPAGVTFTGVRIQGNVYLGSSSTNVQGLTDPEISFNTFLTDSGSNYTTPLAVTFTVGEGSTGGFYRYNLLTSTSGVQDGGVFPTKSSNVESIGSLIATYQAMFVDPKLGANNTGVTQFLADWAMKAGGTASAASTGFTYNAGAVGTGYVNYVTRTASFPLP